MLQPLQHLFQVPEMFCVVYTCDQDIVNVAKDMWNPL